MKKEKICYPHNSPNCEQCFSGSVEVEPEKVKCDMSIIETIKKGEEEFEKMLFCEQCISCHVENTSVLDCADIDCYCHKVRYTKAKFHITSRLLSLVEGLIEEEKKHMGEYDENDALDFTEIERAILKERIKVHNAAKQDTIQMLQEIKKYLEEKI